jgi:predicted nucleic acid-binding protein
MPTSRAAGRWARSSCSPRWLEKRQLDLNPEVPSRRVRLARNAFIAYFVYYAQIVVAGRREGRPIEAFDAQIAAAARVAGADLATRDVEHFAGCGLTLVNPWELT